MADNRGARFSDDSFSKLVGPARRRTACSPRRSGCGRTFRRGCSAISCSRPPRWCSSGCSRPPSPRRRPRFVACSRRSRTRSGATRRAARLFGGPARGRGFAPGGQARRSRPRRLRQESPIRGNDRGARLALLGADRGGGSVDGRRPARSGAYSLQVRGLGLADREGHHHGAAGRPGNIEPGPRRRVCQFRPPVADHGPARDAILAGSDRRRAANSEWRMAGCSTRYSPFAIRSSLRFSGKSDNTARDLRA